MEIECKEQNRYYVFTKEDETNVPLGEIIEGWSDQLFFMKELYPELLLKYNIHSVVEVWTQDIIDKIVIQDNRYTFYLPNKKYKFKDFTHITNNLICKY